MTPHGGVDTLTVINGPEDGAQFSLARGPLTLGGDGACAVCLRLDNTIRACHARLVAANNGYRVRGTTAAQLHLNGRRVGLLRSRTMRSGDVLRVGYTELTLDCAPDGPASRSRGVVTESDAAWILRRLAAFGGTIGAGALQALTLAGFALLRRWKMALVIGAIVLYVGAPNFRASTHNLAAWAFHRLLELVHQIVQ